MKNLGNLFLLLLTAGLGAAAYYNSAQRLLAFSTPLAKTWLILLLVLAASLITKAGVWMLRKFAKAREKGEMKQVTSVYRYAVLIVLVFVMFVLLYGIIGPAITSIGLLAAGLTLALQRPILNLAGWFLIVTKRPFKIGDRVDVGAISGYVHDIALMHTHLSLVEKEEPTGKVVYIPNEQALTQPIINCMKGSPLVWDQVRVKAPATADATSVEKRLLECVEQVVGKEMNAASTKWKVDVKPEARTALEYTSSLQPYLEVTVRYLSNAKTLPSVKTQITKGIIARFKKELKGG